MTAEETVNVVTLDVVGVIVYEVAFLSRGNANSDVRSRTNTRDFISATSVWTKIRTRLRALTDVRANTQLMKSQN